MAIQFTDFSKIAPQESPFTNLLENVFKGYQMGGIPKKMAQEEEQRNLANSLKKLALEHKPKEYELSDALKSAQISKANQPAALKGNLASAFQLRKQLDPNSPTYQQDLTRVNNYIDSLGKSSQGISMTTTPEGGFQVNIGGQDGEQLAMPGLPKLKPGESYAVDASTGKPIGVNVPLTPPELKQESGKQSFNVAYPFISKSLSNFSGKGSAKKFRNALLEYNTNPEAKESIDNYFAAKKLLSAETVTENARIGGNATNSQLKILRKSLDSSEVPEILEQAGGFILPEGYAEASNEIFANKLNEMATAAETNIPAFRTRYFNTKKSTDNKTEALKSALQKNGAKKFKTEFKDEAEFKAYYKSLTPADRIAYEKQQSGGK